MPASEHGLFFDVNFDFGDESVFTFVDDTAGTVPPPPIIGFFLLLDGTNFELLNGENFTLL